MQKEFWLRFTLVSFSIILIFIGLYNIYFDISSSLQILNQSDIVQNSYSLSDSYLAFAFIFLGFIFYFIGRHWKNSLKFLTKFLIGLSIFFLTFFIILNPIHLNAEELANSVQPSIDYILSDSIDTLLEDNIEISGGKTIKLILFDNISEEKFFSNNLTQNQVIEMIETFQISKKSYEEEKYISSLIISVLYEQILSTDPKLLETPIPLSLIKNQIITQGIDINMLNSLDSSLIENLFQINSKAYLTILNGEGERVEIVNLENISPEIRDLIWNNLGFNESISNSTKLQLIEIILSHSIPELEKNGLLDIELPISTIASQIPVEIKDLFNYDLLHENITQRSQEIQKIREDCENNLINFSQICYPISLTKYENFIINLENLTANSELNLPINLSKTLQNYSSIENLEEQIKSKSSKRFFFLFLAIFIFIFSFISYYLHFKIFKRELVIEHIPYYISKLNLIDFIPTFILILIMYLLLKSGKLIEFISSLIDNSSSSQVLEIIPNLPIYDILLNIFLDILEISLMYLILSLLFFLGMYFYLKKSLEKY